VPLLRLDQDPGWLVLHPQGAVCTTTREVVESEPFARLLALYLAHLALHDTPLLERRPALAGAVGLRRAAGRQSVRDPRRHVSAGSPRPADQHPRAAAAALLELIDQTTKGEALT
jgi:hypothetical protein